MALSKAVFHLVWTQIKVNLSNALNALLTKSFVFERDMMLIYIKFYTVLEFTRRTSTMIRTDRNIQNKSNYNLAVDQTTRTTEENPAAAN